MESGERIQGTIDTLERFVRDQDWAGFDPYDILNSPLWSRLARDRPLLGAGLTQLMRYLPLDTRRLWGIRPVRMTKTVSLIVRSHLGLARLGRDTDRHRELARQGLAWLAEQRLPGYHGACWGYSHDWQSRLMFVPRTQPALVCTVFVAKAFLDAFELLGERPHLDMARSSCDFLLRDIPRHEADGGYCFSYVPFQEVLVHNANLLGVELLGRVYRHTREDELLKAALPALAYTLAAQADSGAWCYDVRLESGRGRDWVDNFHTGFVLESLVRFARDAEHDLADPLRRGMDYYTTRFFAADGRPRRSSKGDYPIDLRDCAQAVVVDSLADAGHARGALAKVLDWTLDHMLTRSGLAMYQRWSLGHNPIAYMRFQAWLLFALTCASLRRQELSVP